MVDDEYFTVVFQGSIRKLDRNPLLILSDFGYPVACSVGHALNALDAVTDELEEMVNAENADGND